MQKFSAKLRQNWRRTIRPLGKHGEVQLVRVTKASEIDDFLELTYAISRRTWQF
jgi:Acetyltransferase (GNAT) domain